MTVLLPAFSPAVDATDDRLPLPFHGRGLTEAESAVFGVDGGWQDIPAWTGDRAAVSRRLLAKRHRDIDRDLWRRLAKTLSGARRLPSNRLLEVDEWAALLVVLTDVQQLRDAMRPTPDRVLPLLAQPQPGEPYFGGPNRSVIDAVGSLLADLLADPAWTDPDVFAAAVADLFDAVVDYALAASAWQQAADGSERSRYRAAGRRTVRRRRGKATSVATLS